MRLLHAGFAVLATGVSLSAQRPAGDTTQTLAQVGVSATRSWLPGFLAPVSVSTIVNGELQGALSAGVDGPLGFVPGVLARSRAGGTDVHVMIRGFGARGAGERSNAGFSRGIRVLLDGIPETDPDGRTSFDVIDLALADRLDVVRSNGSALWGNASGGVLNVTTVPRFSESRISLEPMTGSFGFNRISATFGTRLGVEGRAWLTHSNTNQPGWRANSTARRQLLNVGASAPLGPRTSLVVTANATSNLAHVPGPLTGVEFDADPQQANPIYAARRERRHNRAGRLGVNVTHAATANSGLNVSAYVSPKFSQRAERNAFRDITRYHVGSIASGHRRHALGASTALLAVGAEVAYQTGAALAYNLVAGERGTILLDHRREGVRDVGVFAQEEVAVTSRLTAIVGARYEDFRYDYETFSQNRMLNATKSFNALSPRLGASFTIGPRHVLYANLGSGVEVPTVDETDPPNTPPDRLDLVTLLNPGLKPIRSRTYEVGTRNALTVFDGLSGSYDLAVYSTDVSNEIVPYRGGSFSLMAARARRQGVELGASLEAGFGASARAVVNYFRHRYVDYVVDSAHYGVPGAVADYSGNEVVGVPMVTSGVELSYRPPRFSWMHLDIGMRHSASFTVNDANTQSAPKSIVFDCGFSHTYTLASRSTITTRIVVQNILDTPYAASAYLNPGLQPLTNAPTYLEPGLPRSFVLAVTLQRSK
jgi:iron complex outermembrane receptor protein